uniref:Pumilio isogenyy domain family member 4 n=1 Tax=Cajanus cajan TaxID=3821 RepID=A0A151U7L6_CAJCA|nr:Pumilio isogenyy domain family member 4 [Cajanus cajan]
MAQDNHSHREISASGMQDLVSSMEAVSVRNPYGYVDEAALHRMRIIGAANQVHVHHHPIACVLGSPNYHPRWRRMASLAKEPEGRRTLLRIIHDATPHQINMIGQNLEDHLYYLMKDPCGNLIIHKLFLSTDVTIAQMKTLLLYFIAMDNQKLKDVCTDHQGIQAIKMMLENIETQNFALAFIYAMEPIIVELMKNVNGSYVIQQCLKRFPPKWNYVILDQAAENCVEIARDAYGCCVIQKCMEHVEGRSNSQLIDEIISNAEVLAQDPYGNYVVQFLVKKKKMQVNAMLISRLRNRYVGLSMNKYASNVVEGLLKFSEMKHAAFIVLELMYNLKFLNVTMDPFGNYVVQTALKCTEVCRYFTRTKIYVL